MKWNQHKLRLTQFAYFMTFLIMCSYLQGIMIQYIEFDLKSKLTDFKWHDVVVTNNF